MSSWWFNLLDQVHDIQENNVNWHDTYFLSGLTFMVVQTVIVFHVIKYNLITRRLITPQCTKNKILSMIQITIDDTHCKLSEWYKDKLQRNNKLQWVII